MLLLNTTWEKWLYAFPLLVSENSIQIHGILKFNFIWFLPQGHAGDVIPGLIFHLGKMYVSIPIIIPKKVQELWRSCVN